MKTPMMIASGRELAVRYVCLLMSGLDGDNKQTFLHSSLGGVRE
jgi:hypothetical protein